MKRFVFYIKNFRFDDTFLSWASYVILPFDLKKKLNKIYLCYTGV